MSNYLKTLSIFSLEKKKRMRRRIKEKIIFTWTGREEKCEQGLMLLELSDLLFPIIGFV